MLEKLNNFPIYSVHDPEFQPFGRVVKELDFSEICKAAKKDIKLPKEGVIYEPGFEVFEKLKIADELKNRTFGGMDIQVGYCSGHNSMLDALEYHKGSEVLVAVTPVVVLLAKLTDLQNFEKIDSSSVLAFYVAENEAVEFYGTTLHYAPCRAVKDGFITIVVLPKNTNTPLEQRIDSPKGEEKLLLMKNKWLIAHPASAAASEGAYVGITGDNIEVFVE